MCSRVSNAQKRQLPLPLQQSLVKHGRAWTVNGQDCKEMLSKTPQQIDHRMRTPDCRMRTRFRPHDQNFNRKQQIETARYHQERILQEEIVTNGVYSQTRRGVDTSLWS